ncbi:MAG: hypothetical protein ACRDQB_16965 [Thermocrispum sp.]
MKRTFWFGVGIASGVALSRKATKTARQATPSGLASNVGDAIRELAGAVGAFGADIRAGMTEREQELHEQVERSTGVRTRHGVPASRPGRHAAPESARRRAPKADV